jgi:DNA-binding transcriptional MerR regulator/effector-binding domain-containing protein
MLTIGEFARVGQVSPRMLRHYDRLGLLVPERVDDWTGYRSYSVDQLGRLHRLLALRDLGFTLEQIGPLLDGEASIEQLHGMLDLRRAQVEQTIAEEQARLRRVEAHLRAIEGSSSMSLNDVVIKRTDPIRVAEMFGVAGGLDPEHISPVFQDKAPLLYGHLARHGILPGIMVGYYDDPADDGSVGVHVGCAVANQEVPASDDVKIVELPAIDVASVIHHGTMANVTPVYEALIKWVQDSGYRLAGHSRELYHDVDSEGAHVTELQVPIRR